MQTNSERNQTINSGDLRRAIAEGLLYTHSRLNVNQRKMLEAACFSAFGPIAGREES